jgi:hypothetical protein
MNQSDETEEKITLLRLEIRSKIREEVSQTLGRLRSLASTLRVEGSVDDEEMAFNLLMQDYAIGVHRAVRDALQDTDRTARLFDPYDLNWNKDGDTGS